MKRIGLVLLVSAFMMRLQGQTPVPDPSGPVAPSRASTSIGFIENKGQLSDQSGHPNPAVKYLLTGNGINIQCRTNGFSYDTWQTQGAAPHNTSAANTIGRPTHDPHNTIGPHGATHQPTTTLQFHRVDIELPGANPTPTLSSATVRTSAWAPI